MALWGFVVLAADAQTPGKAVIDWPSTPRPALSYSIKQVPFDGVHVMTGALSGDGIAWENKLFEAWIVAKDNPGHSILFRSRTSPSLELGISVFTPAEFLPDISDAIWDRYLAGLRLAHDGACDILEQSSATTEGSIWVPVLGAKTRSITFRYPISEHEFRAETQVFAFCKDRLVVFVLSGPEKQVLAGASAFYSALRSINPSSPTAK